MTWRWLRDSPTSGHTFPGRQLRGRDLSVHCYNSGLRESPAATYLVFEHHGRPEEEEDQGAAHIHRSWSVKEATSTLSHIHRSDKVLLLGDFNARVGSNYAVWNGIIGKHGVGKANSNGTRLLNICSTHDLVVTNTLFQLPNRFKTSWKHPRSGHWHLLDYVITRQSDRQDVSICRVMRGSDCWTDHRLIRAIIRMQIRPVTRKKSGQARLNCRALKDPDKCLALECRLKDEAALSISINSPSDTSSPCTLSEELHLLC